ncbi:bis(5'-nucleosyl)-tetraphosphatase (symmetrical) YqeK [Neglectibacter caecimuris]|uniref:bis(5'-nucleosyl)-tetraphosphatase (symmetrical) YqeK n=1 Tax=Neglectibacter caecimuris TaxID=3093658 RepID=UPI002AC9C522|nr:bis(5'-nucleosyl)-tetraphosphatase (symmetrical) YqeK [Neglectibacter sp. M00184]
MTYKEYEAEVKKHLTPQRYFHSKCVAKEAARLAKRYGAEEEKARIAGILHDIMKDTPKEEQLKILRDFGIILSESELQNPKLWHSLSGAAYCEHVLGVSDREVLSAIACHTSGKKDMALLDKVLFVADYISEDRDYPGVKEMRKLAKSSLEEAIIEGIAFTVQEKMEQRLPLGGGSIEAYNDAVLALREKETGKEE